MHIALRIPAKERPAQGKFSPAFRGPYVIERVLPTGTTAELVDPVSGIKRLANRTRLKFLDAPQPTTPSTPVARKRQRAEPAEPRIVKFVVGKFRPSDLTDIKNAKKRLAKPQTQEALQHKEIIYLLRRLKAYRGARKKVWKVARGLLRLPVERGGTQPPESFVAKMKGQVEDSPAVEEIWDEWSSPFAKLETAPRWGTPSWTSFLTAFSRQFIARHSARVREVRGWREIPEYEPEIQPDPNPVRFIFSALQALGGLLAPRARHDEEDSDKVVEARSALPTPPSSRVSAESEGSAELSPLPAARAPGSARAAPQPAPTLPAAPLPGDPPDKPKGGSSTCGVDESPSWAELGSGPGRPDASGAVSGPGDDGGPSGMFSRVLVIQRGAVSRPRGPGQNVSARVLLGTTVATAVPSRPVAAPAAPLEPSTSAPFAVSRHPSALPSTPEETTPSPPLPDLSAEESRLPESSVTARNPPQQLGMDGLLNGSVGRAPADDNSAAPVGQEKEPAAEVSVTDQPAPKRASTPGR
ncbi:hypothetical protein Emag_006340 [Eimeria magna]